MRPGVPTIDEQTLARAARGSQINFPGFKLAGRQELRSVNGVIRKVGVFDVNHPTVRLCLCRLAAKFALAAFYELSQKIADETYRINSMWTHNQHGEADEIANILKMFPNTTSLKQGAWDTADTFYFRHVKEGDTLITAGVVYEFAAALCPSRSAVRCEGLEADADDLGSGRAAGRYQEGAEQLTSASNCRLLQRVLAQGMSFSRGSMLRQVPNGEVALLWINISAGGMAALPARSLQPRRQERTEGSGS